MVGAKTKTTHRNTLRHWAESLCHRPLFDYHRTLRVALSLGLYQSAYLRTPGHAVVDTAVGSWQHLMKSQWSEARIRQGAAFLNAVNWTVDRDYQLNIPPRPIEQFQLSLNAGDFMKLRYALLLGLPGSTLLLGLLVYWTRRR